LGEHQVPAVKPPGHVRVGFQYFIYPDHGNGVALTKLIWFLEGLRSGGMYVSCSGCDK
jgi:hypothetical protein